MGDINTKIGERIKNIRLQKMMTQKELCGGVITRNMLSCIENGSANPSLATLEYIAERLNVPAGLLISGDDGSFTLRKLAGMENIHRAYKNASYSICIDLCKELGEADDEINMILSKAYSMLAKEEFENGNLKSMCDNFDSAVSYSEKTLYSDERILAEASCYFRYARRISHTFTSYYISDDRPWEQDIPAFGNEFCRYSYMLFLAENCNEPERNIISSAHFENEVYLKHIKAVMLISDGRYFEALAILKELIYGKTIFGMPMLYAVLRQAENCSRQTDDYKSAYEFSNSCISVLDSMLK